MHAPNKQFDLTRITSRKTVHVILRGFSRNILILSMSLLRIT